MSHFPLLDYSILAFPASRALRAFAVLACLAAGMIPGAADARARPVRGAYDGIWNVVFATTQGACNSGYSVPFTVAGRRVSSAGGGRVAGSISRAGGVAVKVSVGRSRASGGGRLAAGSGAGTGSGTWRGVITGDRCSGTWQATRT